MNFSIVLSIFRKFILIYYCNGGSMHTRGGDVLGELEIKLKKMIILEYGTLKNFALIIEIPYSTLDSILRRGLRNSNILNVFRITKELRIDPEQLIVGNLVKLSDEAVQNLLPITTRTFPVLGEIACGEPRYANEKIEIYVDSTTDIDADCCLIARGNSMIGARIRDGDIVFIKEQNTVENGEIAAVIIEEEATLKRVFYHKDKNLLILKAENPSYDDLIYSDNELNNIRILGKAVAFQSDVD